MLNRWVRTTTSSVERGGHRVGQIIKTLLRPVRTAAVLTSAAALDAVRPRSELVAENALLRLQILVLARAAPPRPRLFREDRLLAVLLARVNTAWRDALHLVQPETLLRWHRDLFTLFWRRRSRRTHRSRGLGAEVVELIRTMANANALWGAERIRGELVKLGIRVSKRTIQKYLRARPLRAGRGQTWRTFLRNHAADIWACDFLQLYDAWFRPLFAFVIIRHSNREIVHVNVTRSPTDAWVAQQLREATPTSRPRGS